jgi:hypothetical protein
MRLLGRNRANLVKRVPIPIPTLNLDFVNGSYQFGNNKYTTPNGITGYSFGNSTGGTAFNPNTGLVQNFAPNTPRITGNGLLIEGLGTNTLVNSIPMSGNGWLSQNVTTTINSITAPDGTNTATLCTVTATSSVGSGNYISSGVSITSGLTYTVSAHMKAGTSGFGTLIVNSTGGPYFALTINLSTGVITSTGLNAGAVFGNTSTKSTTLANGWYRIELRFTASSSVSAQVAIESCNTGTPSYGAGGNVPATAGQTIYWWGGQFEQSPVATSYIPTYGAITNLCQQSSQLATSPWSASGITATNNSAIAPDGSYTASLVNVTVSLSTLRQAITVTASTQYTFSFYAKRGTAIDTKYSVYNVTASSEIIVATSYYNQINSNNWTRVSVTFTTPVGCTSVGVYPMRDSQALGTTFIWGCQLQLGNIASTYVPVSPAVTNYCLYSQQIGGTGWITASCTPTLNNTVAPDGTTTATLMTTTSTTASALYRNAYATTAGNQIITNSCWVKAGTNQYCTLNTNNGGGYATAIFDIKNGVVTKTAVSGIYSNLVASIIADPRGNGWFRILCSFTCANSGVNISIQISNSASGTATIDSQGNVVPTNGTTIYMWGAQQELGYGFNQYVLTTTASASAVAQTSATLAAVTSATRTPDTLVYGTSLGLSASNTKAMIAEGSFLNYVSNNNSLASLYDSTTNSFVNLGSISNGGGNFCTQILASGSLVKNLYQSSPIIPSTLIRKAGASFGNNQLVVSQNGLPVPDPSLGNGSFAGVLAISQLYIGYSQNQPSSPQINGYVRSIKLYPSSLSLNQLNTLTSLQNN